MSILRITFPILDPIRKYFLTENGLKDFESLVVVSGEATITSDFQFRHTGLPGAKPNMDIFSLTLRVNSLTLE